MGRLQTDVATIAITNGTVITPFRRLTEYTVIARGGVIETLGPSESTRIPRGATILDCTGRYVVPGFIDIHVNGGGGCDALDATSEALETMCRAHARGGTTALVPTLVTAPITRMAAAVRVIGQSMERPSNGAAILGAYLEGPFLSPEQKGAHNPSHLRVPSETDYTELLDLADYIRVFAIAPELAGALEAVRAFHRRGVLTAVAHSQATYIDVMAAVEEGTRLVTHLFCSMSSMHRKPGDHRKYAGVVETALLCDDLNVELIGDGYHVPAGLLQLALKTKPEGTVALVTDAMRAAGQGPGKYVLGDLEVIVEDGIALVNDRTLYAGSVTTMDACVRNLVKLGGTSLERAVRAATIDPARIVGVDDRKGTIGMGKDADLVVLDQDMSVRHTIIGGQLFDPSQ